MLTWEHKTYYLVSNRRLQWCIWMIQFNIINSENTKLILKIILSYRLKIQTAKTWHWHRTVVWVPDRGLHCGNQHLRYSNWHLCLSYANVSNQNVCIHYLLGMLKWERWDLPHHTLPRCVQIRNRDTLGFWLYSLTTFWCTVISFFSFL